MTPTAEILTTGDELLRGEVVNTNASWLAQRLKIIGCNLVRTVTVGDSAEQITEAVREAADRVAILIISGGLGPTADDRTAAAVASAAGVSLELNPGVLTTIRERFSQKGYKLTPNNEKQAFLPRDATVLPNAEGTAPGFMLLMRKCLVFCVPGVPHEMRHIFTDRIVPQLQNRFSLTPVLLRTFNVFGLGESQIDHLLADVIPQCDDHAGDLSIHFCTAFPENRVIFAVGANNNRTQEQAQALLFRLEEISRKRLGPFIFSIDDTTLSAALITALKEAGASLAVAESCTGGLISHLLTQTPGSSEVFQLGVTAYSNLFKERLLHVDADILQTKGAVSQECVQAMAEGIREVSQATYGLAITGIAGPSGGTDAIPIGTVHFALASRQGTLHLHRRFPFDRLGNQVMAAHLGLWWTLRTVKGDTSLAGDPLQGRWAVAEK